MADQVTKEVRRSEKKRQKPVNVKFFTGLLACIKGDTTWQVVDLNESRKVVQCPTCGADNDIQEAKKRAA